MEGDGETMSFVADILNEFEGGRSSGENEAFGPVSGVDDFLAFSQGGERKIGQSHSRESRRSRLELRFPSIH